MRLVYTNEPYVPSELQGKEVQVGDNARTFRGERCEVAYFRPPRTPASSGKVTLKFTKDDIGMEYYVSVIGAQWIEREDRV